MDTLIVYLNDVPVGRLADVEGRMSFAYDSVYAADSHGEPLSHSLPLRDEPFEHEAIEPFLSGLLPDDIIRTRLGRILQLPRENTFAFLRMAEKLGISTKVMEHEIDRMCNRIAKHAPQVAEKLTVRFPCSCYRQIQEGIMQRCLQVKR